MSTTPAPPHPAAPRAAGPDAGYGYDVDRVDPRAPGRLGDMGPLRLRSRSRVVQWLFWIGTFLTLVVAALLVWFFAIRPLGFGTSLVAFTSALVPRTPVVAACRRVGRDRIGGPDLRDRATVHQLDQSRRAPCDHRRLPGGGHPGPGGGGGHQGAGAVAAAVLGSQVHRGPDRRGRLRRADRRGLRLHRGHPVLRPLLPSGPGRRGDRRVLAALLPARRPLALRARLLRRAGRAGAGHRRRTAFADALLRARRRGHLAGDDPARPVERLHLLPARRPRRRPGRLPALLPHRAGAHLRAAGGDRPVPAPAGETHPAPAAVRLRPRRMVLPAGGGPAGLHAPAPPRREVGGPTRRPGPHGDARPDPDRRRARH